MNFTKLLSGSDLIRNMFGNIVQSSFVNEGRLEAAGVDFRPICTATTTAMQIFGSGWRTESRLDREHILGTSWNNRQSEF